MVHYKREVLNICKMLPAPLNFMTAQINSEQLHHHDCSCHSVLCVCSLSNTNLRNTSLLKHIAAQELKLKHIGIQ